jgi:prevent-host-death family protein
MKLGEAVPFDDYRQHLREHHDRARETGEPLTVTRDGEPEAVVMSPQRYQQLAEAEQLLENLKRIDRSMEDYQAGRTVEAKEALRQIAKDAGLNFNR